MAYLAGTPILILKEGSTRRRGREAQRNNIMAARIVAEILRTTLGPRGMDKMLIDSLGDITITNDGATILDEIEVEHPAAKMMVEVSKAQDQECGDGTTTAVVLAGELLKRAEEMIDQNVHPTIIVSGYRDAAEKAREILEKRADKVGVKDREALKKIAMTAMMSKSVSASREHLAGIAVDAVVAVAEKEGSGYRVDMDNIQMVKKQGAGMEDTELIRGIIVDKEPVHPGMPRLVKKAKIALVDSALEVKKTEIDAKIQITDPTNRRPSSTRRRRCSGLWWKR
jgi:chaperonin GroEL (HSP60 family)